MFVIFSRAHIYNNVKAFRMYANIETILRTLRSGAVRGTTDDGGSLTTLSVTMKWMSLCASGGSKPPAALIDRPINRQRPFIRSPIGLHSFYYSCRARRLNFLNKVTIRVHFKSIMLPRFPEQNAGVQK